MLRRQLDVWSWGKVRPGERAESPVCVGHPDRVCAEQRSLGFCGIWRRKAQRERLRRRPAGGDHPGLGHSPGKSPADSSSGANVRAAPLRLLKREAAGFQVSVWPQSNLSLKRCPQVLLSPLPTSGHAEATILFQPPANWQSLNCFDVDTRVRNTYPKNSWICEYVKLWISECIKMKIFNLSRGAYCSSLAPILKLLLTVVHPNNLGSFSKYRWLGSTPDQLNQNFWGITILYISEDTLQEFLIRNQGWELLVFIRVSLYIAAIIIIVSAMFLSFSLNIISEISLSCVISIIQGSHNTMVICYHIPIHCPTVKI